MGGTLCLVSLFLFFSYVDEGRRGGRGLRRPDGRGVVVGMAPRVPLPNAGGRGL